MDPVSCVSCVSWMHCVYAAETHETFHQESGMRYQHLSEAPIHAVEGAIRNRQISRDGGKMKISPDAYRGGSPA